MSTPDEDAGRRHRELTRLFHDVLEAPDTARSALLQRVRDEDPTLADELTALLEAHQRAAHFIEVPATAALAEAPVSPRLQPLHLVGPYRVIRVAGEGGMGVVYLAEDTRLGRVVALKSVRPECAEDETRRACLRREARAAASLRHPSIATVYALEEIDDQIYVASEFVAGDTLRDELARGPVSTDRASAVALAILGALEAAHQRGIVHRDLKPENIVSTPDGTIKVLDFGLAQVGGDLAGSDRLTKDATVLGTPAYMSPEQIRGEPVDCRSDLFSWGGLVIELLTGQHPWAAPTTAATLARVLEGPLPVPSMMPNTPPSAAPLVEWAIRCLARSPDARPRSAAEIASALSAGSTPAGGQLRQRRPVRAAS